MNNKDIVIQPARKRSIEEAIASDYDFDIGATISTAFSATKGVKLTFFLALLVYLAICFVINILSSLILGSNINDPNDISEISTSLMLSQFAYQSVSSLLLFIVIAGFFAMSLNWLRSGKTAVTDLFSGFKIPLSLLMASILMFILILLGTLLLIIPGIYLATSYLFVSCIILDNPNIKIWDALETSRKIVHKHWFKIFALNLIFWLIALISIIPLGIGLIWTYPAFFLANGIIYRKIFDIE